MFFFCFQRINEQNLYLNREYLSQCTAEKYKNWKFICRQGCNSTFIESRAVGFKQCSFHLCREIINCKSLLIGTLKLSVSNSSNEVIVYSQHKCVIYAIQRVYFWLLNRLHSPMFLTVIVKPFAN